MHPDPITVCHVPDQRRRDLLATAQRARRADALPRPLASAATRSPILGTFGRSLGAVLVRAGERLGGFSMSPVSGTVSPGD